MKTLDKLASHTANNLLHVYLLCAKEGLQLTIKSDQITITKDNKTYTSDLNIYQDLFKLESAIYSVISEVKKDIEQSKINAFDEKILRDAYLRESC